NTTAATRLTTDSAASDSSPTDPVTRYAPNFKPRISSAPARLSRAAWRLLSLRFVCPVAVGRRPCVLVRVVLWVVLVVLVVHCEVTDELSGSHLVHQRVEFRALEVGHGLGDEDTRGLGLSLGHQHEGGRHAGRAEV